MNARPGLAGRVAALALVAALAAVACKGGGRKGTAAPPLAGLDAVPATATAVVGIDVARVAASPLVQRAVEQLLLRDAELAERWQRLRDECKLELTQSVRQVVLALGAKADAGAPVLLVATGTLAETELATCVRGLVGKGGGALTARAVEGRTVYQAKEGNRSVWFGFGRADTVVLGSQEAFVLEALGTGAKVTSSPGLGPLLADVERKEPLWAAGLVSPEVGDRLLKPSNGALKAGPKGFLFSADVTAGARVALTAVMGSDDDAKALESLAKQQLSLLAVAAQIRSLGRIVGKISASAQGPKVRLSIALDPAEINQLLSAVDSAAPGSQDAPPALAAPGQPSP